MYVFERNILREVSISFGAITLAIAAYYFVTWDKAPRYAPVCTAMIAVAAGLIAIWSILSQREIARKRAAMDFFTKTEMDKHTLDQHKLFKRAVDVLKEYQKHSTLDEFAKTPEYWHIRDYLNLHELMAVGIGRDVFDDYVCEDFWAGELFRAHRDTHDLIAYIQAQLGEEETYIKLVEVYERWKGRDDATP